MKLFSSICLLAALVLSTATVVSAGALTEKLGDISVSVMTNTSSGSGVLCTRKVGEDTVTFVWTAGHVVSSLRGKDGEFSDARVIRGVFADGKRVGEMQLDAEIIRFSSASDGEDLALLRIRGKNLFSETVSADFNPPSERVRVGDELYHVGTFMGQAGFNSLSTGIISQTDRAIVFEHSSVVFDQTTTVAFPGSSGGGIFHKTSGKYVGMLVRGFNSSLNLIVPVDRLRKYAKSVNAEWAVDATVPVPDESEIKNPLATKGSSTNQVELRDFLFRFHAVPGAGVTVLVPDSR